MVREPRDIRQMPTHVATHRQQQRHPCASSVAAACKIERKEREANRAHRRPLPVRATRRRGEAQRKASQGRGPRDHLISAACPPLRRRQLRWTDARPPSGGASA